MTELPMILATICLVLLWCGISVFSGYAIWDSSPMLGVVVGAILLILGASVCWDIVSDMQDPNPNITLKQADWECSESDIYLMPVMIGKVIVNQPRTVCVEWSRK